MRDWKVIRVGARLVANMNHVQMDGRDGLRVSRTRIRVVKSHVGEGENLYYRLAATPGLAPRVLRLGHKSWFY
jgi:hypothetical protein